MRGESQFKDAWRGWSPQSVTDNLSLLHHPCPPHLRLPKLCNCISEQSLQKEKREKFYPIPSSPQLSVVRGCRRAHYLPHVSGLCMCGPWAVSRSSPFSASRGKTQGRQRTPWTRLGWGPHVGWLPSSCCTCMGLITAAQLEREEGEAGVGIWSGILRCLITLITSFNPPAMIWSRCTHIPTLHTRKQKFSESKTLA